MNRHRRLGETIDKYGRINKMEIINFISFFIKMKSRQFFILLAVIIICSITFYNKLETIERVNRNIDTNLAHMYDDISSKIDDVQYDIEEVISILYSYH